MDTRKLDQEIEDQLLKKINELIKDVDAVIVSDFVYGVITPRILQNLNENSANFGTLLIGDLQCSSQVGSVIQFKNFNLICPNEREARIGLQDNESGLETICQKILKKTNCKNLIMKLGSNGFIVFEHDNPEDYRREIFPALSANPLDVAGAGDSLLAIMASGLAASQPLLTTAALSCCMTSLAVEKMGNVPISSLELKNRIVDVFNIDV
jgi:bifunctional ADP-heptose synthase (sugar kinase/adenylyltransferase)